VRVDNNTFLFQQHFKATCHFLPPPTQTCFLPFEQLIRQQMVHFQNSISKRLHHHTFSNMFFDEIFEAHRACILSRFSFGVGTWLIVWLIFPIFRLFSPIFSIVLWMWFKLSHLSIACFPWYVCTHPIDFIGIHLLHCANGNECIRTHDAMTFLLPLRGMQDFTWDENNYMHFLQRHSISLVDELTLCSQNLHIS